MPNEKTPIAEDVPPKTTGYDILNDVEFAENSKKAILENLSSKRPNYKKAVSELKQLGSTETLRKALNIPNTGAPLFLLYHADEFMPLDERRPIEITPRTQEVLAQKTLMDRPNSDNTAEDYMKAIIEAQSLWASSKGIIAEKDRESWRQTLCVNALSESAGTDTKYALEIINALNQGIDVTKPNEDGKFEYMINDDRVRALVLRYSKKGMIFYDNLIGDNPSDAEKRILATEMARRKEGVDSYQDVSRKTISEALDYLSSYYKSKNPSSKPTA